MVGFVSGSCGFVSDSWSKCSVSLVEIFFVSAVTSHLGTRAFFGKLFVPEMLSFVCKLVLARCRRKNIRVCMKGNIDFGDAGEIFGNLGNQHRNRNIEFGAAGENFGDLGNQDRPPSPPRGGGVSGGP